ncbi:hypothetical protein [Salinisphaera sp.]|uniref:hypothetical protein n=1 Tax=Salinisphaera sp. TaxID=1914330 RepID=UPI0025FE0D4F|nr:hypothetical protein [Salinisphaera sp.]
MARYSWQRPVRHTVTTLALAFALLLGGCSGAPDAGDLQPLLQTQLRANLQSAQSAMQALGGDQGVAFMRALGAPDPAQIRVENVEIFESRELDNGDYEVRLRYDIVAGDRRDIQTRTVVADKADSGWRLLPD